MTWTPGPAQIGGAQRGHRSLHDGLTGLPNRFLVYDRAREVIAEPGQHDGSAVVLSIDVDGFRKVNHTFGQAAGDELLQVVGKRLSAAVRDCDTVARLGGDEFAVLINHPQLDVSPELIAARLLEVLRVPFALAAARGPLISITASIGIAYGSPTAVDQLFHDADLALYEAQVAGKNRVTVFEPRMDEEMHERLELETDLACALDADQLFLLYQPIFDLASARMTGVEALLRWRHPRLGVIPPDSFIPVAEATGMIVSIGRWVLEQACTQAAAWRCRGLPLDVAVNVSPRQLERTEFPAEVRDALSRSRLSPSRLTLEITETTLMHDDESTVQRLRTLKSLGVCLSVDDFGTGYSSLAYLHQFPVDELKIDRSFISATPASSGSYDALIHSLVQLGDGLGVRMLAEGIEDAAQLQLLQRQGFERGQGFYLARPLEADAVEALSGERSTHRALSAGQPTLLALSAGSTRPTLSAEPFTHRPAGRAA
jgi:diguanylate cyclase (GGDEF)-like protein